jgi:hypothetical protein
MDAILAPLINLGLPGIFIAVLLIWVARLHASNERLHAERIADAKAFTERALALQEESHKAIKALDSFVNLISREGSTHDG